LHAKAHTESPISDIGSYTTRFSYSTLSIHFTADLTTKNKLDVRSTMYEVKLEVRLPAEALPKAGSKKCVPHW
jgi:hypothetical protein